MYISRHCDEQLAGNYPANEEAEAVVSGGKMSRLFLVFQNNKVGIHGVKEVGWKTVESRDYRNKSTEIDVDSR